ncbi:MAG: FtsW/RodA/SpoVE family cell cycle protein, partial [Candidatus Falkowbacteria bacterium]|nr:FtsW/RodA/SpoVE family cell cycle protein [Candidatus Falkowbacteria bacterium]
VALGQEIVNFLNFKKQILFIIIGLVVLFGLAFTDWHFLKSLNKYLYILAALILGAVLLFGTTIRGTRGWFNFGGFNFQPVEFVKIALLLYLSSYFSDLATKVKTFKNLLWSGLATLFLVVLVLLQPDFGSALMLLASWFVLLIFVGFKKKYFLVIFIAAALVFSSAWFLFFKDYQKERILNFINPQANSLDSGYNISQAMIAVGSGGLTGKGVGFGSQSQLKFLPEAQTDFIFAVIAEELGFLGVAIVLSFFIIFFGRSLVIIRKINNDFGIYFVLGALGLIFIQMFTNIGMNMGIMPVVGLSLPFVSYGGSGLIALFALVGIIENIIIKSKISY